MIGANQGRAGRRCAMLAVLALLASAAHAALPGDLPFTRHAPDIEVYPQNFALAQDDAGIVYVGNSEGVLTFDGGHWSRVPMPHKDVVRALAHDGHGRIYVGGYNALGYIERDASSRETWHDLTGAFAALLKGEEFADVWHVVVGPQGVFFSALRHVFRYQPDTGAVQLWRHAGRFGAIGEVDGALLLQFRGEGLRRFDRGEWQPVAGSESLTELLYRFVPLAGGGALMPAPDGLWRRWRGGRVDTVTLPAGFPPSSAITGGVLLGDGTLALPTDSGWVYLLDLARNRFRRSRLDPGFLNDLIVSADGGLLADGDEALYHVDWPAPWTVVGTAQGLAGTTHTLRRWNARWYALSGSGVLRQADTPDGSVRFEGTNWSAGEAWDLLPVDAGSALIADSYAVELIRDGHPAAVTHSAVYPRELLRSRFDADVVFVGTEPGLAVLRREHGAWKLVAEKDDLQNLRAQTLVETAPHELWFGSERGGIWRAQLGDSDRTIAALRHFDGADGIDYGELNTATLAQLPGEPLVALTARGQFRWNGERFERFDLDGLDRVRGAEEALFLQAGRDGTRWAYGYNHVYRQARGQAWRREEIGSIRRGAINSLTFDEDGAPVFCSSYAAMRYDQAAATGVRGRPAQVMLRGVVRQDRDGTQTPLPLTDGPLQMQHGAFALSLRFALADLRRPDLVRYSARLMGLEDEFSDWSADPMLVYKRLPPGRYEFEVRGRDSQEVETRSAPLSIIILPRWYDTLAARVAAGVLAALALLLLTLAVVRWRTGRLAAERTRLQRVVAERTAELELANRRLDSMAHLDGLTGIANRRRLDDYLQQVWTQCTGAAQWLSLLAIDVDRFKNYNDSHGHLAGDELLRALVRTMAVTIGKDRELLARYGGDEFTVILPGVEAQAAREIAGRIRADVESQMSGVTVSIGVAARDPRQGGGIATLIDAADRALYRAKQAGRNRVVSEAEAPPAE